MARAVEVQGLKALRTALRTTDRAALREVQKVTKAAAQIVAKEARKNAPRRTGDLAASLRGTTQGNAGIVRSPLPYAKVHEWGGTIQPRGVPITIKRSAYVDRALDAKADQVGKALMDGFERVARANGWR